MRLTGCLVVVALHLILPHSASAAEEFAGPKILEQLSYDGTEASLREIRAVALKEAQP